MKINDFNNQNILNDNNKNNDSWNSVVQWNFEKFLPKAKEGILDVIERNKVFTIRGVTINFDDDIWDLSSLRIEGKSGKCFFNFGENKYYNYKLKENEKLITKFYIFTLFGRKNINNIRNSILLMPIKIFKYMEDNNISNISQLNVDDYKGIVSMVSPAATNREKGSIIQFLTFYSLFFEKVYTGDVAKWLNQRDRQGERLMKEAGKTKLLPTPFYKKLDTLLYNLCLNESFCIDNITENSEENIKPEKNNKPTPFVIRMLAGLFYIETQTGLRASELSILRVGDLKMMEFDGKECGSLYYRITKTARGKNQNYNIANTNANKKMCDVFNKIVELGKDEREKYNTDLLVPATLINNHLTPHSVVKNIPAPTLLRILHSFCIKYSKYLGIINTPDANQFHGKNIVDFENENSNRTTNPLYSKKYMLFDGEDPIQKNGLKDKDVISLPIFKQFRVYACTYYFVNHVDSRTRASIKGHHKPAMLNYYARPRDDVQNEISLKKELIYEISTQNSNILGSKAIDLQQKLEVFLRRNEKGIYSFDNIEDNIEDIIEFLDEEVSITKKFGGFCMKSHPDRKCHYGVDEHADKYLCASGVCPYHCFMYFNLPETIEKFEDLKASYRYNLENGWKNASQKERNKLIYLIDSTLIPQLDETDKVIKNHSVDWVIEKHPEMENYIDTVKWRHDAEEWKNKLQSDSVN